MATASKKVSSVQAVHAAQRCGNLFYDAAKFPVAVELTLPLLSETNVDHTVRTKQRLFKPQMIALLLGN